MITQFDQRNDITLQKIEAITKDAKDFQKEVTDSKLDVLLKYTFVRNRCCSELKDIN